jgi:hypothetical protein
MVLRRERAAALLLQRQARQIANAVTRQVALRENLV